LEKKSTGILDESSLLVYAGASASPAPAAKEPSVQVTQVSPEPNPPLSRPTRKLVLQEAGAVDNGETGNFLHSPEGSLHIMVFLPDRPTPEPEPGYKDYWRHVYLTGPSKLGGLSNLQGGHLPWSKNWEWKHGDILHLDPGLEVFTWGSLPEAYWN